MYRTLVYVGELSTYKRTDEVMGYDALIVNYLRPKKVCTTAPEECYALRLGDNRRYDEMGRKGGSW